MLTGAASQAVATQRWAHSRSEEGGRRFARLSLLLGWIGWRGRGGGFQRTTGGGGGARANTRGRGSPKRPRVREARRPHPLPPPRARAARVFRALPPVHPSHPASQSASQRARDRGPAAAVSVVVAFCTRPRQLQRPWGRGGRVEARSAEQPRGCLPPLSRRGALITRPFCSPVPAGRAVRPSLLPQAGFYSWSCGGAKRVRRAGRVGFLPVLVF